MSDPQETGAAAPSSRILVLEGPSTPPLVEALRAQGESVVCAAGLSEIEALLALAPGPDAVVLDLSGAAPSAPLPGKGATRKSALDAKIATGRAGPDAGKVADRRAGAAAGAGPGAMESAAEGGNAGTVGSPAPAAHGAPFVLAVTAGDTSLAEDSVGAGIRVSVRVPAGDTGRALREVRGALAQRRLTEVMEELDRLRAAVMHARRTAHDLAQPLTTIMARAQLLAGKLKPEDPHARPLGIICEESEKLAALIEQFQQLKAIASGPGSRAD